MNKIQTLFSIDIKKSKIKPLPDEELHKLLKQAKYGSPKEKKEAKNKILISILPLIIAKCKKYFLEDYIVTNTDLIQEVAIEILEKAIDKFDVDRQEEGKCSLFFNYINYYILVAYSKLKRKMFDSSNVKYYQFLNAKAKEFSSSSNFYFEEEFETSSYEDDEEEMHFVKQKNQCFWENEVEEEYFQKELACILMKKIFAYLTFWEILVVLSSIVDNPYLPPINTETVINKLQVKPKDITKTRNFLLKNRLARIAKKVGLRSI